MAGASGVTGRELRAGGGAAAPAGSAGGENSDSATNRVPSRPFGTRNPDSAEEPTPRSKRGIRELIAPDPGWSRRAGLLLRDPGRSSAPSSAGQHAASGPCASGLQTRLLTTCSGAELLDPQDGEKIKGTPRVRNASCVPQEI
ncbi:hypothetical protein TREES_T100003870 [Tupaia chinensis]|uniref:Uncharacterized protein n=1 Tax=Tupaia chinensis TaxID=246437 RepID=L9L420_TUPCH|nr:hypothetical protein TREES_T100003870 [Tupaia chinensis]